MIHAGTSLRGDGVVKMMEVLRLVNDRALQCIHTDNGSKFISKNLDKWDYKNSVTIDFSWPGKPTDHAFIESFNSSL